MDRPSGQTVFSHAPLTRPAALPLLLALAASCTPPQPAGRPLEPATNAEPFDGVQCSAVRPPTEPDLMAWEPGSRLDLERLRAKGVVAVRYAAEGCNVTLELLSNCIGTGAYEYTPYSANEHKIAHDATELFAQLPLGAASLTGKVKGNRGLRADYMLVGRYALPPSATFERADLKGADCARATHVVSAAYVGGFALVSGEERELDTAATVFGAGGGANEVASAERLAGEGDANACKEAQKWRKASDGCDVPLRIGLLALEDGDGAVSTVCAGGMHFEAGRGCVPDVVTQAAAVYAPPARSAVEPDDMVSIPAGTFMMGSNDGQSNEKPVHQVRVAAFRLDRTEVTAGDYAACVRAGACTAAETSPGTCNHGKVGKEHHPINCVDWNQASAYCGWKGKRLPAEEEWEYAARGSDGRKWPWGNEEPSGQLCWNRWTDDEDTSLGTCAVGSFPAGASPFGALDMAGNVWEWTASGYSTDYRGNRASDKRVARGGGWGGGGPAVVRSAYRDGGDPTVRNGLLGFRCAR